MWQKRRTWNLEVSVLVGVLATHHLERGSRRRARRARGGRAKWQGVWWHADVRTTLPTCAAQYSFEGVWMRLFSMLLRTCEKGTCCRGRPKVLTQGTANQEDNCSWQSKEGSVGLIWKRHFQRWDVTSPNLNCDRAAAWKQRLVSVWLSCLSCFDEAKHPGFGSVSGQCARLSSLQDSTNVEGQRLCKKPPGHRICVDFAVNHPSPAVSCNPL